MYSNIAFEGGGIKGISYVGVLKAFNDLSCFRGEVSKTSVEITSSKDEVSFNGTKSITKFVGTSVGSIFALLMSCSCSNDEIDKYSRKLFHELTTVDHNIFTEGINLYKYLGMHDNINIYNAINEFLVDKYKKDKITFSDLYSITSNELTVVGTCLSLRKAQYFNHINDSDMEVAKAIQISTAVPIFYKSIEYNGLQYADGGIVDNFPVNYFDTESINKQTIGICFKDNDVLSHFSGMISMLEMIEDTQLKNNTDSNIKDEKIRNLIIIDTGNISFLDYNISQEQINKLENEGYHAIKMRYN